MNDKYKKVQCDFGKHLYYVQISHVFPLTQIYDKRVFLGGFMVYIFVENNKK